jgi:LmbE family N-acetylglucosaminyl deacetylase
MNIRKTLSQALVHRLSKVLFTPEARSSLTSLSLLKFIFLMRGQYSQTELITNFSSQQVFVLAPHMDDEVLGCCGTLRRHVLAGTAVTVVYMTDGRRGIPDLYHQGLPKAVIAEKEQTLVVTRKEEATRATNIIGVQERIFLDHPDGQLTPSPQVVGRVQNILQQRQPEVVYHPSLLDLHPDHWATNRVLYAAMRGLRLAKGWQPVYRGYEVWTPLVANRIVDISEVLKTKEEAIEQFQSQLSHTNFMRTILGLNAYRSLYHSQGHGYAEAFFESPPDLYCQLFQQLSLG